ncbi:hypothetical protein KR51_00018860 [Rubidibacter lacunae KORDI 51-2]|uniref:DUF4168 domain-containing protein n=1 Tax=Rubidibacter lacunae KORDI 51-2 TaxID=582515 RepID=U5DP96_9CHRO|nr:DUF4168 domain-containing protein [Rubidibacter lacunae]ERN41525.1 hypothetical protein KR51_00018860 [Rubidibacter lacunae KORDI 51-2]
MIALSIGTGIIGLLATVSFVGALPAAVELPSLPVFVAQGADISDEELQQFANALEQVFQIRSASRDRAVATVRATGMEPERYDEILRAQRESDGAENAGATEAELEQFEDASKDLLAIVRETQDEMQEAVEQEGLDIERYEEIGLAVQNDSELQERIRDLLGGE